MAYLCPQTLTSDEQQLILRVTAKHLRDHVIISVALGTGLRLSELLGLNVGDVYAPDGTPKTRIRVRREIAKRGRAGDVFVPDKLVPKLKRFWRFKKQRGEGLEPGDPLFCSQSRRRLSPRRVQHAWHQWQERAGTSLTPTRRTGAGWRSARRVASTPPIDSPLTTTVYTHPSDEEMQSALRSLPA